MGRAVQIQGRSYFCSVSFPRRLKELLLGVVLIKFISNVVSLLVVVTCTALFVHAVLGDSDTDRDGASPRSSPSDPASSRNPESFKDRGSPSLDMRGNGIGKEQQSTVCPCVTTSRATERGGHTFRCPGTAKHLSLTKGSGFVLGADQENALHLCLAGPLQNVILAVE